MSPPELVSQIPGEEAHSKVSSVISSSSLDCNSHNEHGLKERNYLGLPDCSSLEISTIPIISEEKSNNLNLKATELRLGLPGSQSPSGKADLCFLNSGKLDEKRLFPLLPSKDGCSSLHKNIVSGNKRGFSDAIDISEVKPSLNNNGKWKLNTETASDIPRTLVKGKFPSNSGVNAIMSPRPPGTQSSIKKEMPNNILEEQHWTVNETSDKQAGAPENSVRAPAAKAQVVGWPPVRSFWKNSLAVTSKNNEEIDGKPGPGALYVKVSMDGAPYLRKVDLRTYSTYQELSSALEKMFGWLTPDQVGSHGGPVEKMPSEGKLRGLLQGSEYVLTYEDKDGDWMLVGDVPWVMFTESCKRLKIMKGSDAIGLAPRATEKSKSRT